MKLIFGILLFFLCINISTSSIAFAGDSSGSVQTLQTEILDKDYVQLETSDSPDTSNSISILKTLQSLIRIIQATKSYSLLNWKTYTRRDLQVENYHRTQHFGRWINDPNDDTCYNTRARVLVRDSDKQVLFKDNNHCVVETGHWNDPYTGRAFRSTTEIQIDHVVPLKNAYLSGAYKWNFKSRCLYANYMGAEFHLMSVNGIENMRKGDKGPNGYMPPNPAYTCVYLKNWLTIKFLWGLKMTVPEAQATAQLIKDNHCNGNMFRVSTRQILEQQEYAKDHLGLCKDPEPKPVVN